jgi:hypothetical protein
VYISDNRLLKAAVFISVVILAFFGAGGDSGVGLCAGEVGSRYKEHNALCFSPGPIYYPVSGRVSVLIIVWSFGE